MLTQKLQAPLVAFKRHALCGLVAAATIMSSAPAQAQSCASQPSGLVSWWMGENNTNDSVGGHNGTAVNGTTFAAGKVGQAFSFDGTSGFVQVPDSPSWAFGTNEFTIDLWVNFKTVKPTNILIANDEGPGSLNKWIFWVDNGQLEFHCHTSSIGFNVGVPFTPVANVWYHVAITRSGSTYKFYVNGSPAGSVTNSQAIPDANAPLTIGAGEGGNFVNGLEDEVDVFSRALSDSEILDIYNAGAGGKCGSSLPPSITINDATVTEGNAGTTNPTFTVTRSGDTSGSSTVNYATADDTATQPDDYTAQSGTLTFLPGETAKTFTVPVIGDTTFESTERFFVNLSNATNAIIRDSQGIGTITNDDLPPTKVSISDVQMLEGDINNRAMYFTISLSGPAATPVAVTATTTGQPGLSNPASAPGDFQGMTSTVTFAPGEISKSLPVFIVGDTVAEADENFAVKISSASAVVIVKPTGIGTIVNDDGPGAASLTNVALSPNNATSAAGAEQKFMTTQRDSTGNANIDFSRLLVGSQTSPVLYAQYNAQTNLLYLRNDANSGFIGGFAPGSANVITNSHGSLNCANVQVLRNGTELVIVWALTPTASSAGANDVSLYAHDLAGLTANFEKKGLWTITNAASIAASTEPSE